MRATLRDVSRNAVTLRDWWLDFPPRRRHFWRELLWADGAGWLTWRSAPRSSYGGWLEPPDEWTVFPPAHRLWIFVRWWPTHFAGAARGDWGWTAWPSLKDIPRDEEFWSELLR